MIHALPGMGADHRMFPAPWGNLPDFTAHDWPKHSGELTLGAVARKVCDACSTRDGDILVGASLGGMIACEIAKIRKLEYAGWPYRYVTVYVDKTNKRAVAVSWRPM
jgi:hypothetical protein